MSAATKTASEVTPKPSTNGKPELAKPQIRILRALGRAKSGGLNRAMIAERAHVSPSMTANLGSTDPEIEAGLTAKYLKVSLLSRRLVKAEEVELDGGVKETIYTITAKGRAALDNL